MRIVPFLDTTQPSLTSPPPPTSRTLISPIPRDKVTSPLSSNVTSTTINSPGLATPKSLTRTVSIIYLILISKTVKWQGCRKFFFDGVAEN